jgi:hypothetical protein
VERYNNPKPKELILSCGYSTEEGFFLACGDWSTAAVGFFFFYASGLHECVQIHTETEEWLAGRFGIREKEREEEI